jgi:hypothetical protein
VSGPGFTVGRGGPHSGARQGRGKVALIVCACMCKSPWF